MYSLGSLPTSYGFGRMTCASLEPDGRHRRVSGTKLTSTIGATQSHQTATNRSCVAVQGFQSTSPQHGAIVAPKR